MGEEDEDGGEERGRGGGRRTKVFFSFLFLGCRAKEIKVGEKISGFGGCGEKRGGRRGIRFQVFFFFLKFRRFRFFRKKN